MQAFLRKWHAGRIQERVIQRACDYTEIPRARCSYLHHGHLYALPIDAAAPAVSFRPDLLDRRGLPEPKVWSDVVSIAKTGIAAIAKSFDVVQGTNMHRRSDL